MKKQRNFSQILWAIMGVVLMPGCSERVVDWGKKTFNQGDAVQSCVDQVRKQVRTLRIYDQLATLGIFDALWLSDMVRQSYVQLYAGRQGFRQESYQTVLRRQLAVNDQLISFYVLGYQPYQPKVKLLGDNNDATWSIYLDVDGRNYTPSSIKVVDLPVEYRLFFGKRFNRYQTIYLVTFDAYDDADQSIITPDTQELQLHLSTVDRSGVMKWNVQEQLKIVRQMEMPDIQSIEQKMEKPAEVEARVDAPSSARDEEENIDDTQEVIRQEFATDEFMAEQQDEALVSLSEPVVEESELPIEEPELLTDDVQSVEPTLLSPTQVITPDQSDVDRAPAMPLTEPARLETDFDKQARHIEKELREKYTLEQQMLNSQTTVQEAFARIHEPEAVRSQQVDDHETPEIEELLEITHDNDDQKYQVANQGIEIELFDDEGEL